MYTRRLVAIFLDLLVVQILVLLLGKTYSISFAWSYMGSLSSKLNLVNPGNILFLLSLFFVYNIIFEYFFSRTLGKYMCGLVILFEKETSRFRFAVLRNLGKIVDLVFGLYFILLSDRNQSFGDVLGNTIVVTRKGEMAQESRVTGVRKIIAYSFFFIVSVNIGVLGYTVYKIQTYDSVVRDLLSKAKWYQLTHDVKGLRNLFTENVRNRETEADIAYLYFNENMDAIMRALKPEEIVFNQWEIKGASFLFRKKDPAYYLEIFVSKDSGGEYRIDSYTVDIVAARPEPKPFTDTEFERIEKYNSKFNLEDVSQSDNQASWSRGLH